MDLGTTESSLQVGALFAGRYSIERLIGMGGMGEVYLALDTLLNNEQVALKIIHTDLSNEERNVKRFLREAQLTRKVTHENIARTFDANVFDGRFYFSLEYLDGTVLSELLKTGPVPFYEASRIIQQVCDGLQVIHRAGIVHRDLKPSNLILVSDGVVKITDFGIARPGNSDLTKSSEVLGSAPYMAPELWTGSEVCFASDMYALGVLFYEMLTGVLPLDGDTAAELMFKHLEVIPPRPSAIEKSIPLWIDQVVLKLLCKRPCDRFQSSVELKEALERGIKDSPVVVTAEGGSEPAVFSESGPIAVLPPDLQGEASKKSEKTWNSNCQPMGRKVLNSGAPVAFTDMSISAGLTTIAARMAFALFTMLVLYQATVILLEPYLVDLSLVAQVPSQRYFRVLATIGLIVTTGLITALPLYVISSPTLSPARGLSMLLTIITRLSISTALVLIANAGIFLASYGIDKKHTLGPYLLFITQHVVSGMAQIFLLVPSASMSGLAQYGNHIAINASPTVAISIYICLVFVFSIVYAMYIGFMAREANGWYRVPVQIGVGLGLFGLLVAESFAAIYLNLSSGKGIPVLQIGLVDIKFSEQQLMFATVNWALLFFVLIVSIRLASRDNSAQAIKTQIKS